MQKLLATSTAARPTGSPPQRRLFRVPSGSFAGRIVALYANSPGGIVLVYSDYPYSSWSVPLVVTSDSSDTPFSACIDSTGNIYAAYCDTSHDLKVRKLTFVGGQWSIGAASTIINADDSFRPVILKDSDGKLWCLFDHHRLSYDGRHYVRAKSSVDDGATWGTGPTDLGTALSSAWIDPVYVSVCLGAGRLHAVYCVDHIHLMMRICDLATAVWQDESAICDINSIDDQFDSALSSDSRLGIVVTPFSGGVYFKEHDGLTWSGLVEIEAGAARSPQVNYAGSSPQVLYMKHTGSGYYVPRYASRSGETFSVEDGSPAFGAFDKVFVFHSGGSPQYQDKTAAASNATTGDVFHSDSQALLDSAGDCLYLGGLSKFHRAAVILSTIGSGGVVAWEYWDGLDWVQFVPYSGAFNFDLDNRLVQFWQDLSAAPADWQVGPVYGYNAFWVRARVTTGFSTKPVGTQILAGSKLNDLALVR